MVPFQATILRPAYYIGVDDQRQLVVLGIRGTTQAHDLFTDLCTSGEAFLDGGFAHAGMLHAANWFVKNEGQTLKEQLQQNKVGLSLPCSSTDKHCGKKAKCLYEHDAAERALWY